MCNLSFYCTRNFPASVELHNFSLLGLTRFLQDKQKLKTEDTLYKLDIFRHRPICGLFPLKCQAILVKHLHRFCCWFEWLE